MNSNLELLWKFYKVNLMEIPGISLTNYTIMSCYDTRPYQEISPRYEMSTPPTNPSYFKINYNARWGS